MIMSLFPVKLSVICPNCRGGNSPGVARCMWCDASLRSFNGQVTAVGSQEVSLPSLAKGAGLLVGLLALIVMTRITAADWARIYLKDALDFIQRESIMNMDWTSWRAQVTARAANAYSAFDTYPAITYGLQMLGDNHSQLLTPDDVKSEEERMRQ